MTSQQNIAVFSTSTDSEHKIIQILHRKAQNKIWTELLSLGQEPTFNKVYSFACIAVLLIGKYRQEIVGDLGMSNIYMH